MGVDSMTIDVNRASLSPDEWLAVEALANRIVLEDRPVRAWFPEPAELAALALRKMPDVAGKVRVVDMGGFDVTACGGTHVARTGEIGVRDSKDQHGPVLAFSRDVWGAFVAAVCHEDFGTR